MKNFIECFKSPSNRYGLTPFWFLNGDLSEEELKWQVNEMKEKGLGGYVMHSRYGRRLDYFSEDFFNRVGTIIDESEKLGMNAIVYDEDDWPSGMSGTKVVDDHPEYKHKQMEFVYINVTDKNKVEYTPDKGTIFKAYACRFSKRSEKKEECIVSESKDITPIDNRLNVTFDKGQYDSIVVYVFQTVSGYTIYTDFPKKKGFRAQPDKWSWYFPFGEYVDLLNKDAVAYFIETTCEEYKKRFGEHFGKAIKYFFTDEPGFYTVMRDGNSAVAWSDVFESTFKERKGYDIKDCMLSLAYEAGKNTSKIRYDYYEHLTYLFEHNFVKQYSDWCRANGVHLMGHYRLCYPQLVWQRNYAGNVMCMFRQMDVPGVDRLDTPGMNDTFATKDWSWQIEDKLCSSIGHQYNIERRMTESFACSGWDYRFADMKRVTDWQYMMGMNMLVPHAFHYSLSGQRKKECIPSFFYQNPTWQNYRKYADYVCRLGEMFIGGKNISDIAILYPMTTLWSDDIPKAEVQDVINNIDRDFSHITDLLLRQNLDYDIIAEDELAKAYISDGSIKIGAGNYKLLVVPPMITLREKTDKLVKQFIDGGGRVLFLSMPPVKNIDGESLESITSYFDAKVLNEAIELYKRQENVAPETITLQDGVKFIISGVLRDNEPNDLIVSTIESLIERDVKISIRDNNNGTIYYNHFEKEDCEIIFINNSNEDMTHDVELSVRAVKKYAYICDVENGEILKLYKVEKDGRTYFDIFLEELKSYFIIMSDEELEANGKYDISQLNPEIVSKIKLSDVWNSIAVDRNTLILDTWTMKQNEVLHDDSPVAWDSGFGTRLKFESEFHVKNEVERLQLVIDRNPEMIYEGNTQPIVYKLNGVELVNFKTSDFLDHDMRMIDVTDICVVGKNILTIEYDHKMFAFEGKTGIESTGMMWDCAYIIGDFALQKNSEAMNDYDIIAPAKQLKIGSWTSQGYVYFNGCMQYTQEFDIKKDKNARYILDMGHVIDTVQVEINGTDAGERVWMPYTLDITEYISSGTNKLVLKIRNTPINIFDKANKDCGIMTPVCIKIVK